VNAPRPIVYRALLDARAVAVWKVPTGMTSHVHGFDAREGGRFRVSLTYDAPTGTGKTEAHTDTYHGRFLKLVPDQQVVEVVEFETTDPALRGEMTITTSLADADGGTEVLAVHDGLPPGVPIADNEAGWREALAKLAALVEAGWTPKGMSYDLRDSRLPTVLAEAALVAEETKRVFSGLSDEQVNWKPGAEEWSIGQCFDHLIVSNQPFVPIFEEILAGRRRPRLWERMPGLPRLFGRLLIAALRPDSGRKLAARPAFYPSRSRIAPAIIGTFLEQQERLRQLMDACRHLDLDGITITSPVLRVVTYSLMDACRIIVVHEQNHFVQATRVMETPGFPGACLLPI
jgi:uncharacterized protein YndB with AHSA1/START domain